MTWNESATHTPRHRDPRETLEEMRERRRAMEILRERTWRRGETLTGRHSHEYSETAESLGGRHRKPKHRAEVAR